MVHFPWRKLESALGIHHLAFTIWTSSFSRHTNKKSPPRKQKDIYILSIDCSSSSRNPTSTSLSKRPWWGTSPWGRLPEDVSLRLSAAGVTRRTAAMCFPVCASRKQLPLSPHGWRLPHLDWDTAGRRVVGWVLALLTLSVVKTTLRVGYGNTKLGIVGRLRLWKGVYGWNVEGVHGHWFWMSDCGALTFGTSSLNADRRAVCCFRQKWKAFLHRRCDIRKVRLLLSELFILLKRWCKVCKV